MPLETVAMDAPGLASSPPAPAATAQGTWRDFWPTGVSWRGWRSVAVRTLREVATETATTVISRLTGAAPDRVRLDSAIRTAIAARPAG